MASIKTDNVEVKRIAKLAFPEYRGRKFRFQVQTYSIDLRSYWDGGTRSYFKFVCLADGRVSIEVPVQSAFDKQIKGLDACTVPEGFVCVEHVIFCGKDLGLRLHVHPNNVAKLLTDGSRLEMQ